MQTHVRDTPGAPLAPSEPAGPPPNQLRIMLVMLSRRFEHLVGRRLADVSGPVDLPLPY